MSDARLERIASARRLYGLVVFAGSEECVTPHVRRLIEATGTSAATSPVDERRSASPRDLRVLARIPHAVGGGTQAETSFYRRGRAQVFAAGAVNFGASAHWPRVSRLLDNLWTRLSGEPLTARR